MKRIVLLTILSCAAALAQGVTCSGQASTLGGNTTSTSGSWPSMVYGVNGAAFVYFATWSVEDGQDDIVWYSATQVSGTNNWQANIDLANHRVGDPDYGQIAVQVWAYPPSGAPSFCGDASFLRLSSGPATADQVIFPPATLSADPNSSVDYHACGVHNASAVVFPTWTDANQDDTVWYAGGKVLNDPNCPANTWSWKRQCISRITNRGIRTTEM